MHCQQRRRRHPYRMTSTTPPPERRTPWLRVDADWLTDDKVVHLGVLHGPAGPLTYMALLCAAKTQDRGGALQVGWHQLAHSVYLSGVDVARAVIGECVTIGLLEDFEDGPVTFSGRVAGWERRQRPADPTAAVRKARQRARKRAESHAGNRDSDRDSDRDITVTSRDSGDVTVLRKTETVDASPPMGEVAHAHTHTREAGQSEPDDPARTVTDVVAIGQAAADRSKRGYVDQIGVENAIAAFPGLDHRRAAHAAVTRMTDPAERHTNFAKLLMWELERQDRPPAAGRGGSPSAAASERDARRKRRGEALERLMSEGGLRFTGGDGV